jgi:molybdenum cofactor cytidylyltransferase
MKESSSRSAVVLAAGSSTRMGTVKQLLPLDSRPLLEHVLDNVRQSPVGEIILVLGHAVDAIRQKLELRDVKVVFNGNYREGMGSSLKLGLSSVDSRSEAALIVLADQPFVRAATFDRLFAEHARTKAQIVIPTYRGFRGNPVLLDRSVFSEVMGLTGDIGCRAIFGDHLEGIVKLPVDDPGILLDLDQKSDYEKLRSAATLAQLLPQSPGLEERRVEGQEKSPSGRAELIIVGKDLMAITLAKLARLLTFTVTLVDPFAKIADFPDADRVLNVLDFSLLGPSSDRQVVVASRGACDEEALEQAVGIKSAYIALVANRRRGEEVRRRLAIQGTSAEALASVRIPAGLEIGASTAEEVALCIMTEIVAERHKRLAHGAIPNRSLDDRSQPE